MSEKFNVILEQVDLVDLPLFIKRMQEAFSIAVKNKFGTCDPIPSEEEVKSAFYSENTVTYHVILDGQRIGGAVLTIDESTQHNSLDLFFISPEYHSRGLGVSAWKTIEERYPDTVVWQTITPYFEERNINFYVNKCGFHIVEFFNQYHIDPNMPCSEGQSNPIPGTDAYFRFEKVMKQA